MLIVNGYFTGDGGRGVLMNVYAPCSSLEKAELWEIIKLTVLQNADARVCVVGDFNSIRSPEERVGKQAMVDRRDMECFGDFISQSNLHELTLVGRSFTWYRPDGTFKSKIDRMLVNNEWLRKWPNQCLKGLKMVSFRPHTSSPAKRIQGLGPPPIPAAFRLKEKLKLFKKDLRGWNKVIFGDIDYNIDTKKEEIEILDRIDNAMGLEEAEIIQRNKCTTKLIQFSQWKEKCLAQKAKARWLREGDVNSSYFHGWINRNWKSNTIVGFLINNRWLDSVEGKEGRGVRQDVLRMVGEGRETKFWSDIWVGTESLGKTFNRLFRLSCQQEKNIGEMGGWGESGWKWSLIWRRGLRISEQVLLNELMLHLSRVTLRQGEEDVWRWRHSRNGLYSTATAYQKFRQRDETKTEDHKLKSAFDKLWKSYAPSYIIDSQRKKGCNAWASYQVRAKSNVNCEESENSSHLLINCRIVHNIWSKIHEWTGVTMHSIIMGYGKKERIASTIWSRNKATFNEEAPNINKMIVEIKARSWNWVTAKAKEMQNRNFTDWSTNIRRPHTWYPVARRKKKKVTLHVGPTNRGKTYHALKQLELSSSGIHCGPLRLLAWEIAHQQEIENLPKDKQEIQEKYAEKCRWVGYSSRNSRAETEF
ncbi:hypothetical protein ACS0TY_026671 [Phlomoides rotata]